MDKKVILVYIDSLYAPGGIERIVTRLILEWKKKYSVIVITKDMRGSYYSSIDEYISINNPKHMDMNNRWKRVLTTFINSISSSYKLRKKLKEIKYDYVYVTTPMNALEWLMAGGDKKRIVVSEHGSAYGVNRIYKLIKKIVYPKVRVVSVPNSQDVDYYKKIGANAVYVPHLLLKNDNVPNTLNTKLFLNVGRLTKDKRQDLLLKAWASVKNKNGWTLRIVGDGELKCYLIQLINDLKIDDTVSLLPATHKIEEVYKQSSCFVFTSQYEGFGLVLTEAMSFGIPCISFDCPSGPKDIVNSSNGFLIENGNISKLSKCIESVISMSTEELDRLGHNAYNTIKNWDNDAIMHKWEMIFSK